MKRLAFALALYASGIPLVAQGTFQTSPPGLLTSEGYQRSYIFGEWSNARLMFFDGELRQSVMAVKGTAFRADQTDYYAGNGMGRTWSDVTLDISTCDIQNISQTFSKNPTSTPTRVFRSKVTFPTRSGYPTTRPAPFSIDFPFQTTWIYAGAADICLDYDFNGGVLANGGRWSPTYYETYYTDSFNGGDHASGSFVRYGAGCTDTGNSSRGTSLVFTDVYTSRYPTAAYRDNYRISTRTRYTAIGQSVVHAVALTGSFKGTSFAGVACERVYLDLNQPILLFPTLATSTSTAEARVDFPLFAHNPAFEGLPIWIQGAWNDSATGTLRFTDAERTLLPPMPRSYQRKMIYQNDITRKAHTALSSQGSLTSPFDQATHNPILRYEQ